ncbi:MAG TPA: pitrilysin family protein [Candidatus Limnocylindria bacterium]|nr:pitrilysin family protein [Candidatus Limnocylindria bacterium]
MSATSAPASAGATAGTHRRSVLDNGLRVVTQSMPQARSASVALVVPVGSRHEDAEHAGLSHILEHLVFKGTRRHPEAGTLSQHLEGVGGSLNASTDRELTVYSAKVPAERLDVALEAVSELALHPLLRRRDLTAEKPVIVDEIRMYVDSPSDHVFTLFDELLYGDHPLGREIAGTIGSVRRATHEAVLAHWRAAYRPAGMVLSVAGRIDHDHVTSVAAGWTAAGPEVNGRAPRPLPGAVVPPKPAARGTLRVSHRRLSQGNLCLGMPGVARDHPDRWALDLVGAVLGDGMGSRLFLELRERQSLVYDVSTFSAMYADAGTFGIHAGFDPEDAHRVVSAILAELERVVDGPVPAAELERARAYTRGRLELRMEDSGAVAGWLAMGESLLPRILTVEEVIERLEAVTADDLLRVARRYLAPTEARLAVLGPFRSRRAFERALHA